MAGAVRQEERRKCYVGGGEGISRLLELAPVHSERHIVIVWP
jgi:hypothetical protein